MGSPEANATAPTPGAWSDTDLLAKLRHMFWSGRVHVHFDVTRYTKAHDQIAEPGGVSIGAAWLVVFVINGLVLFYILAMVGSKIAWLAPVYHFAESISWAITCLEYQKLSSAHWWAGHLL
jgi:hypothetical protein